MPTPVTHLSLAEEILRGDDLSSAARRLLIQQRGPFLLGHTAPDVKTVSGQDRHESHFYTIPRTSERPAYELLFDAHPSLARAESLPPPQAAFIAGYIAHLLLDEIYSIEWRRGRPRLKKSFGTAMKVFGNKWWPNISTFGKLAILTFIVLKEPGWMEQYENRITPTIERTASTDMDRFVR